jgi:hypothetical protein
MLPLSIEDRLDDKRIADTLAAGFAFAARRNWRATDRAQLYGCAERAFGGEPDFDEFRSLYDGLVSNWQIARGGGLAPAATTFDLLVHGCADCARGAGLDLVGKQLRKCLCISGAIGAMAGVKANAQYPHVAAAKLLHFYNPRLFPIYDDGVIWKEILTGPLLGTWSQVCRKYGIEFTESTHRFLATYCAWAGEVMQAASPNTMQVFSDQFRANAGIGADHFPDLSTYYAAAFEYILFGLAAM